MMELHVAGSRGPGRVWGFPVWVQVSGSILARFRVLRSRGWGLSSRQVVLCHSPHIFLLLDLIPCVVMPSPNMLQGTRSGVPAAPVCTPPVQKYPLSQSLHALGLSAGLYLPTGQPAQQVPVRECLLPVTFSLRQCSACDSLLVLKNRSATAGHVAPSLLYVCCYHFHLPHLPHVPLSLATRNVPWQAVHRGPLSVDKQAPGMQPGQFVSCAATRFDALTHSGGSVRRDTTQGDLVLLPASAAVGAAMVAACAALLMGKGRLWRPDCCRSFRKRAATACVFAVRGFDRLLPLL